MKNLFFKLLSFVFSGYYKRKEKLRHKLLFRLFTKEDYEAIEDSIIDQLAENEQAESENRETTDDEFEGKIVTIYMPNGTGIPGEDEGLTVASFPVNKYLARVLDSEDNGEYHLEPFKAQAIKHCIEVSQDALAFSQENPLDDDE